MLTTRSVNASGADHPRLHVPLGVGTLQSVFAGMTRSPGLIWREASKTCLSPIGFGPLRLLEASSASAQSLGFVQFLRGRAMPVPPARVDVQRSGGPLRSQAGPCNRSQKGAPVRPKSLSWMEIRDALLEEISSGRFRPGERLPSETELSGWFRAGRHSVRRALDALSAEGRVRIEHGRGAFVQDGPAFQYTIDRRDRLFDQLERAGHKSELVTLAVDERSADEEVAMALGVSKGASVHVSEVLLLADGAPLGIGQSHHPAARFPDFRTHRRFAPTQRMFYRSYGIAEYFREDTYLWARPATPDEADLLQQHPSSPVVETRARDTDALGAIIGFSMTIWAASRLRFVLPARR